MEYKITLGNIIHKYPFMYQTNTGIYFIGSGVFQMCSNQLAIEYFNRYKKIIEKVQRERIKNNLVNNEDAENLVYYFRKIMSYSDYHGDSDSPIKAKKDTLDFLNSLPHETKESLLEQLEDYVYIFKNYYYALFW